MIKMRVGKGPAALLGWEMGPRQDPRLVLAPRRQPAGHLGIGGPAAWEAGGPAALLPWTGPSPVRSHLAKEGERRFVPGRLHRPWPARLGQDGTGKGGLPAWLCGCQGVHALGTDGEVLQIPWPASLSQEKELPPTSQRKEKPVTYRRLHHPLSKAGVQSPACLGSIFPLVPCPLVPLEGSSLHLCSGSHVPCLLQGLGTRTSGSKQPGLPVPAVPLTALVTKPSLNCLSVRWSFVRPFDKYLQRPLPGARHCSGRWKPW